MKAEGYAWIAWGAAFVILETYGLLRRKSGQGMTLTYFIETHVPRWVLACAIGWLAYHFLIAGTAGG